MRKRFTFLIAAVVLLMMMVLPMRAWAEDSPDYTYTLSSGNFTATTHSHTSGAYTWTHEHGAGDNTFGWDETYGFKFGSGNKSYPTSFTLTSSSVSSNIKKVVVTASVNSGKSCKLDVKVGSTTYGSQVTINTKNNDTWEFSIADASTVNGAVELSFSSNTGPLYLKKIEIYYYSGGGSTVNTPQIIPNGGSFYPTQSVELSCTTDGASIYYTTDGTAPSASSTLYSSAFSISSTCTVKAIATKSGMTNSSVAEATFTKITPYANIAALTAQTVTGTYYVTFTNATVTYTNGNFAYIQDASGAVVLYKSGHGYTAGDVLNGTATVSYKLQNNNPQITELSGVTKESGDAPAPTPIAQSAWSYTFANVLSQYFKIVDATITKTNNDYYVSLGGESIKLYKPSSSISSLDLTKKYAITGFPMVYNSTKEIQVFSDPAVEDITIESSALQLSYAANASGSMTVGYSNFTPISVTAALYSDSGCSSSFSGDWISITSPLTTPFTSLAYNVSANETGSNRTVYMKVSATNANSTTIEKIFTITQVLHQTYSVTYKANGGTGNDLEVTGYDYNTTVAVKANEGEGNPNFSKQGYTFQNWNTNAGGTGTTYIPNDNEHNTFNITANTNLFAQWQADTYDLHTAAMTNGSVSFKVNNTAATTAKTDETVTIIVTPASGYKLSSLTVTNEATSGSVTVSNTNTFTMPASHIIVNATFEVKYSYDVDFESSMSTYTNWEYANITAEQTTIDGHGGTGTKYGKTNGTETAYIQTKDKIASPGTFVCYISKKGTNTNANSYWKVQYSSNGSTWTTQGDDQAAAVGITEGTWTKIERDLSGQSNVYIRIYYTGSTAVRAIDDISLEYTPAQEYTLTVASVANIDIKATVGSTDVTESHTLDVEAAKTVNLTVVSEDDNYQFDEWVVYNTDDESTTVTATNNSFTMPEYPVTVSATTKEVRTITYSVNGTTSSTIYDKGTVVELAAPSSGIPDKFTFVGWTADPANTADENLETSYTANENATFFAVFKKNNSITLTGDDFGSYDTSEAEVTMQGLTWGRFYVMKNGGIQFKKDNQGYFYNKTPIKNLTTIIATRKSGTTDKVTIKAGNSANPTSASALSPSISNQVDTYTVSGNEYVRIQNLANATPVYTSFEFRFTGDNTRYTRVFPDNTPATEDITITGPTIITSGSVLDMDSYTLTCNDASNLIIEDGGQLIFSTPAKAGSVKATLKKEITGFGNTNTVQTGWYTIASPLTTDFTPTSDMLTATYDLYYYDEEGMKWKNYRQVPFEIAPEKGYLYANTADKTISFAGDVLASDATVTKALSFAAVDDNVKGFNLMGNPFTCNITNSSNVKIGGAAFSAYYIADGTITAGQNLIACNLADREIKPCEGFFVQATAVSQNLEFNPVADPGKRGETKVKSSFIRIEAGNEDFMDRAYVQLGEGNTLRKMTINDNVAQVYVMNDGKDYAAATIAEAQGEMPVNFKASQDGQYTITVNSEDMEMGYLHLIDNIAGKDIDLLATPSYTFNAKGDDYESRFRLVFSANMTNAEMGEGFAFISDGQLVIANEGEATLQVIDVTGRVVANENINGTCSKAISAKAGVYVLRLINGTDVKTQKMVIR